MFDYEPLWATMEEKNCSTYALLKSGIQSKTLYNLKHGKSVTVLTLEKLCTVLDCHVEDIVYIERDR